MFCNMELYKKYPKLCTLWCYIETAIFAGMIYGWGSLMAVLKEEGFYGNDCPLHHQVFNETLAPEDVNSTSDMGAFGEAEYNSDAIYNETGRQMLERLFKDGEKYILQRCVEQDSSLNMCFLVGTAFAQATGALLGPMMKKLGMRFFRVFYTVVYMIGLTCLAFASPMVPWLIGPGVACIGAGGLALYCTNVQMSFLFPKWQSTVMAFYVGLFDVSSSVQQLVKVAYERGTPRRHSYLLLTGLCGFICLVSTLLMMPSRSFTKTSKESSVKTEEKTEQGKTFVSSEPFLNDAADKNINPIRKTDGQKDRAMSYIFSPLYLLHLMWMCMVSLRFTFYLATLNPWLTRLAEGNKSMVNKGIAFFSYTTNGTVIAALTAGLLHDQQRRLYQSKGEFVKEARPMVIPLTVTILLAATATTLTFFQNEILVYASFVVFTMFRSYGYSYQITYISEIFPKVHFPFLLGIIQLLSVLSTLLQYPMFKWYEAYPQAPTHVTIFLLSFEVISLSHPAYLWWKCRQHKTEKPYQVELLVST